MADVFRRFGPAFREQHGASLSSAQRHAMTAIESCRTAALGVASLIETCKLNRVNPQAYFADLLTRLVNGWPQRRIDELMPWNWQPDHPS